MKMYAVQLETWENRYGVRTRRTQKMVLDVLPRVEALAYARQLKKAIYDAAHIKPEDQDPSWRWLTEDKFCDIPRVVVIEFDDDDPEQIYGDPDDKYIWISGKLVN